jgi:hypothetical protein
VGPAMVTVAGSSLFALTVAGAAPLHDFFAGLDLTSSHLSGGAVASRGPFVAAAREASPEADGGDLHVEVAVLRLSGELLAERKFIAPSSPNFTESRLFGNDRGIFAFGFRSYPDLVQTEVVTVDGKAFVATEGVLPLGDPDAAGFVLVQDETTTARPTSWLDPCSGELRPTRESERAIHYGSRPFGDRLVYVEHDPPALAVETSQSVRRIALPDPEIDLFALHPSGWALISAGYSNRFFAVQIDTEEVRSIVVTPPSGLSRYAAFTGGVGSNAFDATVGELVPTSTGGIALPLRDAVSARLHASQDGAAFEPLGLPIGLVYESAGMEVAGTFLHFGNNYAVSLPEWDPPADGVARLDNESMQSIRPSEGSTLLIEQSPMGQNFQHSYRLSRDGGCLGITGISGGDVKWVNTLTDERFSFALPPLTAYGNPPLWAWTTAGDLDFVPF